jgi:regulator of sigma E protease
LFFVIYWATGLPQPIEGTVSATSILPDSPADKAGMEPGSQILSVDGQKFTSYSELADFINEHPNEALTFAWKYDDSTYTKSITPAEHEVTDSLGHKKMVGRIGIGIGPMFKYMPTGPIQAFKEGASATFFLTGQMFKIIWELITRQVSIKNLGGPVMIAQQAGRAAKQGFLSLLGLAAFLSVNLAILNILPIPVLDGGHLVFLTIEAVKRRPVSIKSRMVAQQIGMALLLLLMVVVTYNDIIRVFTGMLNK